MRDTILESWESAYRHRRAVLAERAAERREAKRAALASQADGGTGNVGAVPKSISSSSLSAPTSPLSYTPRRGGFAIYTGMADGKKWIRASLIRRGLWKSKAEQEVEHRLRGGRGQSRLDDQYVEVS